MTQSPRQITINTKSGHPYVSVIDEGNIIGIQLHDYTSRVIVYLDKKCIPELSEALKKMKV